MATRRQIKKAVRGEIVTACSGIIPSDQVRYTSQEQRDLAYPHVIYAVFDVPVRYNTGSQARHYRTVYDSNNERDIAVYRTFWNAVCDISINGDNPDVDELYEAIRSQFVSYELFKPDTQLNADVTDITVGESNTPVNTDTDPTAFETMLTVDVEYRMDVTRDGSPIRNIAQEYDIDDDSDPSTVGDGTIDVVHTTS